MTTALKKRQRELHAALLSAIDANDTAEANRLRWALIETVEAYIVSKVAHRAGHYGLSAEAAVSAVRLYCAERIHLWEPERGAFSSYVTFFIKSAFDRTVAPLQDSLSLPLNASSPRRELRREMDAGATLQEAAKLCGMSEARARAFLRPRRALSLDAPITPDNDTPLRAILPEPDPVDMDAAADIALNADRVQEALAELPERQRTILLMMFGLDGYPEMTLAKAGRLLGLSRERVRQLSLVALRSVRAHVRRTPTNQPPTPPAPTSPAPTQESTMPAGQPSDPVRYCRIHHRRRAFASGVCANCMSMIRDKTKLWLESGRSPDQLPGPATITRKAFLLLDCSKLKGGPVQHYRAIQRALRAEEPTGETVVGAPPEAPPAPPTPPSRPTPSTVPPQEASMPVAPDTTRTPLEDSQATEASPVIPAPQDDPPALAGPAPETTEEPAVLLQPCAPAPGALELALDRIDTMRSLLRLRCPEDIDAPTEAILRSAAADIAELIAKGLRG